MSLYTPVLTLTFTPSLEIAVLQRSIVATRGGHQDLLRDLHVGPGYVGPSLDIEDTQLQTAYRYAYEYGSGGYQDRFRVIIAAAHRAGWSAP